MPFTWKASLISPLVAPAIVAVIFGPLGVANPIMIPLGVLFFFIPGAVIGVLTMFLIFLPPLWAIGRFVRLGVAVPLVWGTLLGALWSFLLLWMNWKSSGTDSGPPDDTFVDYALRWNGVADFLMTYVALPVCGLVTAALYWWMARRAPVVS
jgi:hypothetical protein